MIIRLPVKATTRFVYIASHPRKKKKKHVRERKKERKGILSHDISLGEISRNYSRANLSNYLIVKHLVVERERERERGLWEGEGKKTRHRAMSN